MLYKLSYIMYILHCVTYTFPSPLLLVFRLHYFHSYIHPHLNPWMYEPDLCGALKEHTRLRYVLAHFELMMTMRPKGTLISYRGVTTVNMQPFILFLNIDILCWAVCIRSESVGLSYMCRTWNSHNHNSTTPLLMKLQNIIKAMMSHA